jgi:hypothetical protein
MKHIISIIAALAMTHSVIAAEAVKKEEPKKNIVKPIGKDGKPVEGGKKPAEVVKK